MLLTPYIPVYIRGVTGMLSTFMFVGAFYALFLENRFYRYSLLFISLLTILWATVFEGMFGSRNPPPFPIGLTIVTGLIVMTMNKRYQRLGDLVCGTMVVIEERSWLMGVARLEDPRAAQLAAYLPPNYVVSRSLAKTLATYVERRQYFSLNRRREIARHLAEPLLVRFGLPADTSHDLLLCALYYRTFIADRGQEETTPSPSPFQPPGGQILVQANLNPPPVSLGEIRIRT